LDWTQNHFNHILDLIYSGTTYEDAIKPIPENTITDTRVREQRYKDSLKEFNTDLSAELDRINKETDL
jgi:hypothetical protein